MGGRGKNLRNSSTNNNTIIQDPSTDAFDFYKLAIIHNRTDSEYHNILAKEADIIGTDLGIKGDMEIVFLEAPSDKESNSNGWVNPITTRDGWGIDSSKIFVVVRPGENDYNLNTSTIAHELTHIQQARAGRYRLVTSNKLGNKKGVYFDGKLAVSLKEYRDVNTTITRYNKSKKPSAKLIINHYFDFPRYKSWPWEKEAFKAGNEWKERLKSK